MGTNSTDSDREHQVEHASDGGGDQTLASQLRWYLALFACLSVLNVFIPLLPGPLSVQSNDKRTVLTFALIGLPTLTFMLREVREDLACRWAGIASIVFGGIALATLDWRTIGWTTLIVVPLFLLPMLAKLSVRHK